MIGNHIKQARNEKGLTQAQLAEKCGMSQQQIAQYENGTRSPKNETLAKIEKALGLADCYFFANYTLDVIDGYKEESASDLKKNINLGFEQLNEMGQQKAVEQVELLTKIPEYKKEN